MQRVLYVLLLCFFITSIQIYAESMSGGTYTLNGSVGVIVGQGQAGAYTINSSGDAITMEGSTGSTYTLYPSPYARPQQATEGQAAAALVSAIFGNENNIKFVPTVLHPTTPVHDGSRGIATNTQQNSTTTPFYKKYIYNDVVHFGRGTSTAKGQSRAVSPYINWLIIKIICIGLLLIFIRMWHQYKKNL